MPWQRIRPGLYRLHVDGNLVGEVERGAERRDVWYPTAIAHNEETGLTRRRLLVDAQSDVERFLANV